MYADSQIDEDDEGPAAGESLQLTALLGYAALIVSDAEPLGAAPPIGTIGAHIELAQDRFYGRHSESLTRSEPFAAKRGRASAPRPKTRAADLIAELHEINTKIHQITFQVERAVSLLATSG